MIEKNYNIHDIVRFRVLANNISSRMGIEYKNFESDGANDPDFTVYLGDFLPSDEGCTILDKTYFVKEDYFYCKDSYKLGKWKLELSGFSARNTKVKISVNLVGNYAADMFICAFIIDFLIRFKMEEKGYSVVHASAVSKDGHAYLFPSHSGAGKTTTALYFAEIGYNLLGDDFVIIHEGDVINYLTPLNIFSYNLNNVLSDYIGTSTKYLLNLKNFIYKTSFGYIKIFTKVNPKDVFPAQVKSRSKLESIYLLAQKDAFYVERADRVRIINNLLINQMMESGPFLKYLLEYGYVFPESPLAKYWDTCKSNLERNLGDNVSLYSVDVPKIYDKETFDMMRRVVECGI
jgi:hypothetical protein